MFTNSSQSNVAKHRSTASRAAGGSDRARVLRNGAHVQTRAVALDTFHPPKPRPHNSWLSEPFSRLTDRLNGFGERRNLRESRRSNKTDMAVTYPHVTKYGMYYLQCITHHDFIPFQEYRQLMKAWRIFKHVRTAMSITSKHEKRSLRWQIPHIPPFRNPRL